MAYCVGIQDLYGQLIGQRKAGPVNNEIRQNPRESSMSDTAFVGVGPDTDQPCQALHPDKTSPY